MADADETVEDEVLQKKPCGCDDTTTVSNSDVRVLAIQLTVAPAVARLLQLLVLAVLTLGFTVLVASL
jgi:hypothetical protein